MLVRSYRTVSPLPSRAVCSLWHFPASHLGLPLAITLLYEVRTFLESLRGRPANSFAVIEVTLRAQSSDNEDMLPPARYLMRAKDFVDARYAEPITVNDLAAAAGLSRAHFSRMFTRTFGESPSAYLQTRRLERAAALLRYTDRSVAEICVMVGFSSVGSFTTTFAQAYGRPPAAYRASMPPAVLQARVPNCIVALHTRPKTAHQEKTNAVSPT
jgi:AraC-like DNA-binding protein